MNRVKRGTGIARIAVWIEVIDIGDLPVPPEDQQRDLFQMSAIISKLQNRKSGNKSPQK
jgi:hypothetical protein